MTEVHQYRIGTLLTERLQVPAQDMTAVGCRQTRIHQKKRSNCPLRQTRKLEKSKVVRRREERELKETVEEVRLEKRKQTLDLECGMTSACFIVAVCGCGGGDCTVSPVYYTVLYRAVPLSCDSILLQSI